MTSQRTVIEPAQPPEAFLRAANPVIRRLLRVPLAGPLRRQLMVLRFTGRKSGRRFEIPVAAHWFGGELYSLTGAPWRHNFRDGAQAQIMLDGRIMLMRGELLTDPRDVAPVYRQRIEELGVKGAQRMLGIKVNSPGTPTTEAIAEAARRYHLCAIRFTPGT